MPNSPLNRVSLGAVKFRAPASPIFSTVFAARSRTHPNPRLPWSKRKHWAQRLDLNQQERPRLELPGHSGQSGRRERKGRRGGVGAARHLARLRKFHSLSRAGRYRMWARRETLRDLRPSIASSCPPLPPQGRPRTRRGLLGQDPGPRTQCQDLALEPKPSFGSSHPHRSQDRHSVAELCLWSYPLLKITHWKVRGPLSLNGLGPGRGD